MYHWSPLFRIDFPAVAFTLAGIFCVWRWEKTVARSGVAVSRFGARVANPQFVFAILFFLLALYTKHSLVVAPAAAALALFLRDKRAGIVFALMLGAIGGAIFLALEIFTRGGWSFGLLTANATVWSAQIFLPLIQSFVLTYAILLALGAWSWVTRVCAKQIGVLEIYA